MAKKVVDRKAAAGGVAIPVARFPRDTKADVSEAVRRLSISYLSDDDADNEDDCAAWTLARQYMRELHAKARKESKQ